MRIVTVVGARPQFVKCAPVSRELRRLGTEILVHTGQHYDESMSELFFRELQIPRPKYHLGVGSDTHGAQTGEMLRRIEDVLLREQPDVVLVYGDTNSTLAGALAAAKLHLPLAHVEAGLRSYNRRMPEEVNRVLTDHVSDVLLCPTETAVGNLAREGVTAGVHLVGDVMYAAWLQHTQGAWADCATLRRFGISAKSYALATVHRAENTDDPDRIMRIFEALEVVGEMLPVIVPLHPRTKQKLKARAFCDTWIRQVPPVSYLEMLELERHACLVLTDSGGVQKEAFWAGVPCVTLRDETEWVETVTSGWNRLAGIEGGRILAAARAALEGIPAAPRVGDDGRAVERIVEILAALAR